MAWVQTLLLVVGGPIIVWSVLCGIRDTFHARSAARDLPIVARELGLKLREVRPGQLPELHGKVDGFQVEVRRDAIEVTLREDVPWHADHMSFPLPPPWSWVFTAIVRAFADGDAPAFDFEDRTLNRFFRTRSASSGGPVPEALRSALGAFVDRHSRLSGMRIGGSTITCTPTLGHSGPPKSHAISGAQVRALLPDLLTLSRAFEAACRPEAKPKRSR